MGATDTGLLVSRSGNSSGVGGPGSFVVDGPVRFVPGVGSAPEGLGRVLVVQSDSDDGEGLRACLSEEGYRVEVVLDGADALRHLRSFAPHLVLLDSELPDMSGTELCRRMRDISSVPVIVVARLSTEEAVVLGLEAGAADYVVKPYQEPEIGGPDPSRAATGLSPCVHGSHRGAGPGPQHHRRRPRSPRHVAADRDGAGPDGPPEPEGEFDLLWLLMVPAGRVRTREELIDMIWGGRKLLNTRTLDTHIRRLRLKIEDGGSEPKFLVTVRGVGFRFDADGESDHEFRHTSLVS